MHTHRRDEISDSSEEHGFGPIVAPPLFLKHTRALHCFGPILVPLPFKTNAHAQYTRRFQLVVLLTPPQVLGTAATALGKSADVTLWAQVIITPRIPALRTAPPLVSYSPALVLHGSAVF